MWAEMNGLGLPFGRLDPTDRVLAPAGQEELSMHDSMSVFENWGGTLGPASVPWLQVGERALEFGKWMWLPANRLGKPISRNVFLPIGARRCR